MTIQPEKAEPEETEGRCVESSLESWMTSCEKYESNLLSSALTVRIRRPYSVCSHDDSWDDVGWPSRELPNQCDKLMWFWACCQDPLYYQSWVTSSRHVQKHMKWKRKIICAICRCSWDLFQKGIFWVLGKDRIRAKTSKNLLDMYNSINTIGLNLLQKEKNIWDAKHIPVDEWCLK